MTRINTYLKIYLLLNFHEIRMDHFLTFVINHWANRNSSSEVISPVPKNWGTLSSIMANILSELYVVLLRGLQ